MFDGNRNNLTVRDQIVLNIPNTGKVTATASIAVVATTSALLQNL